MDKSPERQIIGDKVKHSLEPGQHPFAQKLVVSKPEPGPGGHTSALVIDKKIQKRMVHQQKFHHALTGLPEV